MKEPRKDILLWIIFFHNRVHLRVHRLGEVKTWQWHYKAHVYPDVFIPQTVSFRHCAFIFPLPTIKWSSSVWGLKIWYFGIYWINHILLTQGEICGVHCAAGMAKVITIVFSSMLSQWLKETASWPNRISNQFLLCWDHIPFVRVPRWLVQLLERGDGLHSDCTSLEYFFSRLICPQWEFARTTTQGLPVCSPVCHCLPLQSWPCLR